eukprot:TRINITY_DN13039_c0_g1_i1.p1 TRINITY_DN13039_c0_g1~~TRINITY_DN13039_c0_g1_i1.p1  ORF type:complete len:207 (+),score=39.38 TRINITY_DN13039_c0_g1_i1:52-672(+)
MRMQWLIVILFVSAATSLECYEGFGTPTTCLPQPNDDTPVRCALVTTLNNALNAACRSVKGCELFADMKQEGVILDFTCCDEDGCNDPGTAPPSGSEGPIVHIDDPDDPVYKCATFGIYPAWEGTAEECVAQDGGDSCVFCAVQNGDLIFQTCSPRYNYTCFDIDNSEQITAGYCNAGYSCPAGTTVPSVFVFLATVAFGLFSYLS